MHTTVLNCKKQDYVSYQLQDFYLATPWSAQVQGVFT